MKAVVGLLLVFSQVGLAIQFTCYEKVATWAQGASAAYFYRPLGVDPESKDRPGILILSGHQRRLDEWPKVDALKKTMLDGKFEFTSLEGRIGGEYDEKTKVFYVGEGHHRLAAALEIARDSGNWASFNKLIRYGEWEKTVRKRTAALPLPVRSGTFNFLGWSRFLGPFIP